MIKAKVIGQKLSASYDVMVDNVINYHEAEFTFDDAWNGMQKVAHFKQKGELTDTIYDVALVNDKIGREAGLHLGNGQWIMYLHGVALDSDDEVIERITTTEWKFYVSDYDTTDGEVLPEITPSIAEQVTALATQAKEEADVVYEFKDELEEAVDEAVDAKDTAVAQAVYAQGYANDAQTSAGTATAKASLASSKASEASGYAELAHGYANDASGYADDASDYADECATYADKMQIIAKAHYDAIDPDAGTIYFVY